jgi:hypothetical protein
MTADVWAAWLAILVAPWLALMASALLAEPAGRTATSAVGLIWCAAGTALIVLLDRPAEIALGDWFVLPGRAQVPVPTAWIVTPAAAWGVASSGLSLWWVSERDESGARWGLVQVICGVAAQTWFVDNVWWLLLAQSLLLGSCAVAVKAHGLQPMGFQSLWLAGFWAEAVFVLATLAAALSLGSLKMTVLSAADRIAELASSAPGVVALVGLLWWVAACGRLFQFPFSRVRDAAAQSSPLMNMMMWGVALLPLASRWLLAGRWWWSAEAVGTDLVNGWSTLAALAGVWCALASSDPRVRVAWLLGTQGALAVHPLVGASHVDLQPLVVEQWSVSLCAAAWLIAVLPSRGDSQISTSSTSAASASAVATVTVWLAMVELTGITVWPWCTPLAHAASSSGGLLQFLPALRFVIWFLCGLATVQSAAEARAVTWTAPSWWGVAWLLIAPMALVLAVGRTATEMEVSLRAPGAIIGPATGAAGVILGFAWQRCPSPLRQRLGTLWSPLVRLGGNRFSMAQVFLYGITLPLRGLAQLCLFLDWFVTERLFLDWNRRVSHGLGTDDELPSAGVEFYALALWLAAAALIATVMWLGR